MRFEYSVEEPLNREPPVQKLTESFITEQGAYDRNHGPIPHLNADDHVVHVDGDVHTILELSVEELRTRFTQHEIVSALQCAGNRRHSMRTLLKEVSGIDCAGESRAESKIGLGSVKWLERITVQRDESTNHYQRFDYKRLPPQATDVEAARKYWELTPALQDMPINSVIAIPQSGQTVRLNSDDTLEVKGYAIPQGNQGPVVKVEVSTDIGQTWTECNILAGGESESKWAWSLWMVSVRAQRGTQRLLSRATDKGGNVQTGEPVWNLRGVAYDGHGEARDLNVI
ncbi:uncharacterized protein KY384_005316 [Bacidia gigantensis]|uniref:uncharacterized protein n=1 Tax=Bacidia gigantensis TaxID=2732470 RepID=UPI001D03B606|nr:uncharacterized protein KY384_005316 [Bacidia gigantensis]KAG8529835.1 hypothetical protein KY384_005316 [Bacidia gigantensis]